MEWPKHIKLQIPQTSTYLGKHGTFAQCPFNVDTASTTLNQHCWGTAAIELIVNLYVHAADMILRDKNNKFHR